MTRSRDDSLFDDGASRSQAASTDEGRTLDSPSQAPRRLIPCPGCRNVSPVPDDFYGQLIRCRRCGQRFRLDFSPVAPLEVSEKATLIEGEGPIVPSSPAGRPDQIGRFQVLDKLGRGQFGTVFRAYDPQLDREVALKVPRPETLDSLKRINRFLRESRAAARLQHPHIVSVHDAGHDGNHYYIAQAFIRGQTLAEVIDQRRLGYQDAARVVRQLADALAYAHGLGIVHRDVKPANIMLDEHDQPHLMDFGLAYQLEAPDKPETASASLPAASDKLTQDGAVVGTPAYMAPEQIMGQGHVASDQYSLGIVLYELLTGQTPFAGPPHVVQFNHQHTPPPPPRSLRAALPRDLEAICLKALAKKPEERYLGCRELAEDLRRFLDGEAVHARLPGIPERVMRWCRREPGLAIASLIALASLIVIALISVGSAVQKAGLLYSVDQARQQEANHRQLAEDHGRRLEIANLELIRQQQETQRFLAQKEALNAKLLQGGYFTQIALADRELRDRNIGTAQQLLDRCPKDLRQWEWRYLNRLAQREQLYLHGSAGAINSVAVSPDGRYFATANQDETITIWSLDRRQPTLKLQGHTGGVRCVVFSPDGKLLASASTDKTVRLWDTASGREVRIWHGHAAEVRCLAFSPNGQRLASGSGDETVRLWGLEASHALFVVRAHGKGVTSLAFSPDGRVLATAGFDQVVRVWDAGTGRALEAFPGYSGGAFGPDGRAALIREDGTVMVFPADAKQGPPLELGRSVGEVQTIAFSPSGRRLATAGEDGAVRIWDTSRAAAEPTTLRGHTQGVTCVVFSPDGNSLASASRDRTVRIWDLTSGGSVTYSSEGKPIQEGRAAGAMILAEYIQHVHGVAFSRDGQRFYSAAGVYDPDQPAFAGTEIKVWNAATYQEIGTLLTVGERIRSLAISPEGDWIALGGKDQIVRVWSTKTGEEVMAFAAGQGTVNCVAFSPDGKLLASASDDRTVRIYDLEERKQIHKLAWHTGPVLHIAFSADSQRLASGGADHHAAIWDVKRGFLLTPLRGHGAAVKAVAFSPDGLHLASGGSDALVMLWNLKDGQPVATLQGHSRNVLALAFNPDGRRLASASSDKTVKIWDVATQQEALSLRGKVGFGHSLAFSPDGQRLAAASSDGAKLWDARALTPGGSLESLVGGLRHADPLVRSAARRDLIEMGAVAAPRLLQALASADLRVEAALTLGGIRPVVEDAIPILVAALGGEEGEYRSAAQEALSHMGRPAVAALAETLRGVNPRARAAALLVLGRIGPEARTALPRLLALADHADPKTRAAVLHALREIDPADAGAQRLFIRAMPDADAEVRAAAQLAALRAGKPVLPLLARLLRHQDSAIRRDAVDLVYQLGVNVSDAETPATLPWLLTGLPDDDGKLAEIVGGIHPLLNEVLPELRRALRQPVRPAKLLPPALAEVRYVPVAQLAESSHRTGQDQLLDILRELADWRSGPPAVMALALATARESDIQVDAAKLLVRHLQRTAALNPRLPSSFQVGRVSFFIRNGKLDSARKVFDDLLEQYPDFSRTRDAEQLREMFAGR